MGTTIELTAADGHKLSAYRADPPGKPRGALVVVQEIFGVTDHVKRVADQYAARGYRAIAPAMFDRIARDLTVPYTDVQRGLDHMRKLVWPDTLADVAAAADEIRATGLAAVVGF